MSKLKALPQVKGVFVRSHNIHIATSYIVVIQLHPLICHHFACISVDKENKITHNIYENEMVLVKW